MVAIFTLLFGVMPKIMYLAFPIFTLQSLAGLNQTIDVETYTHVYVMAFFCGGMSDGVGQMNHFDRRNRCGRGFRFPASMQS